MDLLESLLQEFEFSYREKVGQLRGASGQSTQEPKAMCRLPL